MKQIIGMRVCVSGSYPIVRLYNLSGLLFQIHSREWHVGIPGPKRLNAFLFVGHPSSSLGFSQFIFLVRDNCSYLCSLHGLTPNLSFLCCFVRSCLYVFVVCVFCLCCFLSSSDHKSTVLYIGLLRASPKWLLHQSIPVNRSGSSFSLSNTFHL